MLESGGQIVYRLSVQYDFLMCDTVMNTKRRSCSERIAKEMDQAVRHHDVLDFDRTIIVRNASSWKTGDKEPNIACKQAVMEYIMSCFQLVVESSSVFFGAWVCLSMSLSLLF